MNEEKAIKLLKDYSCCAASDDATRKEWIEALDQAIVALSNQEKMRRAIALWEEGK